MSSFRTDNFTFIDFKEMDGDMSKQVWECRNLPEIRKWMVNPDLIPYDCHTEFVESLKHKTDTLYFSVLHEGDFIGSVNIHMSGDGEAERGIYIHSNHWGNKFAKKICSEFYSYVGKNFGITHITTKVLKENIGSNSLEGSLNAKRIGEDERFYYYRCDLNGFY